MQDAAHLMIGTQAACTDGLCGRVSSVVFDPVAQRVTHLVIQPRHRHRASRLVPLDLIEAGAPGLRLDCTLAGFDQLRASEQTDYLPADNSNPRSPGPSDMACLPYYRLRADSNMAEGTMTAMRSGLATTTRPATSTTYPLGQVAVRRGDQVHATDGNIGQIQGLVIEPAHHHVTHVLLQEGHIWGRKQVAIPINAVNRSDHGIRLDLTKHEIQDLEPIDIDNPNQPTPIYPMP